MLISYVVPSIETPRLRLVASTPESLHADFDCSPGFSDLIQAQVPAAWPPEHWEPHCVDFLECMFRDHPYTQSWSRYVVLRDSATLIGTVGGFPRTSTEAEIGYGILPEWQRRGLATEAALALIGEILRHRDVETITAQTFPHLIASVRVMQRCGMQKGGSGDEEGTIRYRMRRADFAGSRNSPA